MFKNDVQLPPEAIHRAIRAIILKSELKPVRGGMQTLETFYMGKLMKSLKGKVDPVRAREMIRSEAARILDIIPPEKGGSYCTVEFKKQPDKEKGEQTNKQQGRRRGKEGRR
jgi:hypothetical protein